MTEELEFNREYWIVQLLKEVGLEDIKYENLTDAYEVSLDSPMGRGKIFVKAKDYIDQQLEYIEDQYEEQKENIKIYDQQEAKLNQEFNLIKNDPIVPLVEKQQEQKEENFHFYDMRLPDGRNFTVIVHGNINDESDSNLAIRDQHNFLSNHWSFVGKRSRHELTGLEFLVSYYQFTTTISNEIFNGTLRNPNEVSIESFGDVFERMDKVFDGVKMNWEKL